VKSGGAESEPPKVLKAEEGASTDSLALTPNQRLKTSWSCHNMILSTNVDDNLVQCIDVVLLVVEETLWTLSTLMGVQIKSTNKTLRQVVMQLPVSARQVLLMVCKTHLEQDIKLNVSTEVYNELIQDTTSEGPRDIQSLLEAGTQMYELLRVTPNFPTWLSTASKDLSRSVMVILMVTAVVWQVELSEDTASTVSKLFELLSTKVDNSQSLVVEWTKMMQRYELHRQTLHDAADERRNLTLTIEKNMQVLTQEEYSELWYIMSTFSVRYKESYFGMDLDNLWAKSSYEDKKIFSQLRGAFNKKLTEEEKVKGTEEYKELIEFKAIATLTAEMCKRYPKFQAKSNPIVSDTWDHYTIAMMSLMYRIYEITGDANLVLQYDTLSQGLAACGDRIALWLCERNRIYLEDRLIEAVVSFTFKHAYIPPHQRSEKYGDKKRKEAARVVSKWYRWKLAKRCINAHLSDCAHCAIIKRNQYVLINNTAREMFHILYDYCAENNLEFVLCRGTVLAAFYYGMTVMFSSSGYVHWVDGDHDVVIFDRKPKRAKINKIHIELGKRLGVNPMFRANHSIASYLWYDRYGSVDLSNNPHMHPHHAARDKRMHHFCVDVGILYVENDVVRISNTLMEEQIGVPRGVYPYSELQPVRDVGVTYYGKKIYLPQKWCILLSRAA
jgi:hypothetical protein